MFSNGLKKLWIRVGGGLPRLPRERARPPPPGNLTKIKKEEKQKKTQKEERPARSPPLSGQNRKCRGAFPPPLRGFGSQWVH